MYQDKIALTLPDEDFATAQRFIGLASSLLYAGKGRGNNFARDLPIDEGDALRVLLGVPVAWLTDERQQIFDTLYAYANDLPFITYAEQWQCGRSWQPQNPNRTAASLERSCLDMDFIEQFGLRPQVWEKQIFNASLSSYQQRIKQGESVAEANLRLLLALGIFGFRDPYQFFTAMS